MLRKFEDNITVHLGDENRIQAHRRHSVELSIEDCLEESRYSLKLKDMFR